MFTDRTGRLKPMWAFVLSALLSCAAFLVAGYAAAALAGDHVLRFEAIFRPVLVALLLGSFSWLLTVGDRVENHRIAAQGLPLSSDWARQFCAGCTIGLLLVIVAVIPVAIGGNVVFLTVLTLHSLPRVAVVVIVLISGALAEELMFRGYPFQRLVAGIGGAAAIVLFSVLFGVVHLSNPGASVWSLINTVAIGVLFAMAYLRTGALWLPWGIHFAWNAALGLILGLPVSGLRLFNVAVRATVGGPNWLTGGRYGVEASVSGTVAICVGFVIVGRFPFHRLASTPELSSAENQVEDSLPNGYN
jgi:uncharacterized protein